MRVLSLGILDVARPWCARRWAAPKLARRHRTANGLRWSHVMKKNIKQTMQMSTTSSQGKEYGDQIHLHSAANYRGVGRGMLCSTKTLRARPHHLKKPVHHGASTTAGPTGNSTSTTVRSSSKRLNKDQPNNHTSRCVRPRRVSRARRHVSRRVSRARDESCLAPRLRPIA